MASHAEWAEQAEDLIHNRAFAAQQYDIGQVSHMTGLAQTTIEDSLTRERITNPASPRGALCRPAYRIGDNTPLWAPSQVQDYFNRQKLQDERLAANDALPTISVSEARQRGLVTNREIIERFGVHDQTVRRHQRNDANYPAPVAKLSREGTPGVPELLRPWDEIVEWARTKRGLKVPEEWAA